MLQTKEKKMLQPGLKMILTTGRSATSPITLTLPPHVSAQWIHLISQRAAFSAGQSYTISPISSFHAQTHWHTHIDTPYSLTHTIAQCQSVSSWSPPKGFILQYNLRWQRNSKPLSAVRKYNSLRLKRPADSAGFSVEQLVKPSGYCLRKEKLKFICIQLI